MSALNVGALLKPSPRTQWSRSPFTATKSVSTDEHIFKFGFNYLFNAAPVVAKY